MAKCNIARILPTIQKTKPMTLTKEEIEMIEREAEMLASQNSNGQRDWWMVYDTCKAVATKYLLQLKQEKKIVSDLLDQLDDTKKLLYAERERAGKLMEAFEELLQEYIYLCKDYAKSHGFTYEAVIANNGVPMIEKTQTAINEYNKKP